MIKVNSASSFMLVFLPEDFSNLQLKVSRLEILTHQHVVKIFQVVNCAEMEVAVEIIKF